MKFQTGQKVQVIKATDYHDIPAGSIVTILGPYEWNTAYYDVLWNNTTWTVRTSELRSTCPRLA